MKISTKGRYALRMMVDLAEHQNGEYISLKDIALRQEVSKKYLEQIVPILNKSGFLKTNRGYQGGYMLAKPPRQYTVGDILRLAGVGVHTHDLVHVGEIRSAGIRRTVRRFPGRSR